MPRARAFLFLTGPWWIVACGGAKSASQTPSPSQTAIASAATPGPRGSANVIVESEIAGSGAQNALEVIQLLRPAILRPRTGVSSAQADGVAIVIYLDGVRAGELQALTAVPANRVREIRYINATDATTRFGTGHTLGAVLVTTKR